MDRKRHGVVLRDLAGFLILTVLLLAGLFSGWRMCRNHEVLSRQLEDAAWFAMSGRWHHARKTALEARRQWQRRWNLGAVFADHDPMEEIDSLFAQLTVYAAAEDRVQFSSACESLSRRIQAMADENRVTWWNLL